MKRLATAFVSLAVFLPLLLLSEAVPDAGSRAPTAQAAKLGIDDQLTAPQERLLSGFASFTLAKNGNDAAANFRSSSTYLPLGSGHWPRNKSPNRNNTQDWL